MIAAHLTEAEAVVIAARCAAAGMSRAAFMRAALGLDKVQRDRTLVRLAGELIPICALLRRQIEADNIFNEMRTLTRLDDRLGELIRLATLERTR